MCHCTQAAVEDAAINEPLKYYETGTAVCEVVFVHTHSRLPNIYIAQESVNIFDVSDTQVFLH